MLNYIWFFMIVIGVIYGFITGNIEKVGSGAIESATEAVKLCITMVGIKAMVVAIHVVVMAMAEDTEQAMAQLSF